MLTYHVCSRILTDADGCSDDDTMEVPEAYAPIREANGAEAKFLLRFLFKVC
jgi:hypothetical protein